jgi:trigger factor
MQVSENKVEGLKRSYTITIAANDIAEQNKEKIAEIKKHANLPGFRPGKIPESYIAKRFAATISGETIENIVKKNSEELVKSKDLKLASQPKIDIKKYEEGKDLEYNFECEILPEIKPLDYDKIKINGYKISISEAELEKQLELRAKNQKVFIKIEDENAKSKKGNAVKIDYKGFIDGEQFEGGTAQDHQLELGSNSFIDNFEDQLTGLKAGSEKKVQVKFPDDYHSAQFKGKKAEFEVKIKEILSVTTPKIDDEFAKSQGFADLKSFKQDMQKSMAEAMDKQAREQSKKELFDYFADKLTIELPESMVNEEYDVLVKQYLDENKFKDIEEAESKDPKSFKKTKVEYLVLAKRRVKIGLILSDISKAEKINVSDNDALESIKQQFASYPGNPDDLLKYYRSNPQALDYLKGPLIENKVVDFIIAKLSLKNKELTIEQFKKVSNS